MRCLCLPLLCLILGLSFTPAFAQSLRRIPDAADGTTTAAVVVRDSQLIQTTQLFPTGTAGKGTVGTDTAGTDTAGTDTAGTVATQQVESLFERFDQILAASSTSRKDIVKLNLYVANATVRDAVLQHLPTWSAKDALPAVAFVGTSLPHPQAVVALDAVVAAPSNAEIVIDANIDAMIPVQRTLNNGDGPADWCVMPRGDVVYVAGQAEPGELAEATRATLQSLLRTLEFLDLDRRHIAQVKCFVQPMTDIATVNREIATFFENATVPPVSHVEWISGSRPIEIEVIASAPTVESASTVSYHTPPGMTSSPVYSRVARIHGDNRIYIAGLYASDTSTGEAQVQNLFGQLNTILTEAGSDVRHLAKATYYVSDNDASSALNALRPSIYDPERPPSASKALIHDTAFVDRTITLDMIAAPTGP